MATICRKWGLWIYRFREFIAQQASSRLILTHETRLFADERPIGRKLERTRQNRPRRIGVSFGKRDKIYFFGEIVFFSCLEIYRVILT